MTASASAIRQSLSGLANTVIAPQANGLNYIPFRAALPSIPMGLFSFPHLPCFYIIFFQGKTRIPYR
jgi:hypothetical protein